MSVRTLYRLITKFHTPIRLPEQGNSWPVRYHVRKWCNSPRACWKCRASTNSEMFCKHCKALQKPDTSLNYFDLFHLTSSYDITVNELTKQYRQLQSVLHPDKYASSSEDERNISEEYSSIINKAYTTLQQPLARGLYMLELQGIHLEEGNVQSDPTFLMEIMERNEEVDQATNEICVKAVSEKNKKKLDELVRQVSKAFKSGDLVEAKNVLIKMKYFSSIEAKIKVLKIKTGFVE